MSKKRGLPSIVSLITAVVLLSCAAMMLLPLVTIKGPSGEILPIPGVPTIFGGEVILEQSGGLYSFSFDMNICLLVVMQAFVLSAVACSLGRHNVLNRIVSLVLCLGAIVACGFVVPLVCYRSSLSGNGIHFGIGTILVLVFAGIAFASETFLLVRHFLRRD